jgi:hypothetical protein
VTRAVLLALGLYVVTAVCFLAYTGGLIEGVKMAHAHVPLQSDIGF